MSFSELFVNVENDLWSSPYPTLKLAAFSPEPTILIHLGFYFLLCKMRIMETGDDTFSKVL